MAQVLVKKVLAQVRKVHPQVRKEIFK